MKKLKIKKLKGFTLVELIIVITILAILATIAFVSFQGYTKSARDSNRISTLNSVKKGLDLYAVQTSSYPNPDGSIVSGTVNGQTLVKVGVIQDTISKLIRLNGEAKDPLTQTSYTYGTTSDNRYYQIASIKEDPMSMFPMVPETFAAGEVARVDGNYNGYLKFSSGSETWIANLPSIVFNNTGTTDLLSASTYYLVNKKSNLPYNLSGGKDATIKAVDGVSLIKDLTKSSSSTLTGVNITNVTASNFSTIFTGVTLSSFNISGTDIATASNLTALQTTLKTVMLGESSSQSTSSTGTTGASTLTFTQICTTNGQIIYTDANGIEIGRVENSGSTITGTPGNLTAAGHIVVCIGNQNGYVLRPVNEGASTVGTGTSSYGELFQWGNNAPLRTATTSTTRITSVGFSNSNFSNPTFITPTTGYPNDDWSLENNDNLWGDITNTNIARKGPCSTGYHIPTYTELCNVIKTVSFLGYDPCTASPLATTSSTGINNISNFLKIPLASGTRENTAGSIITGGMGFWTSSKFDGGSSANFLKIEGNSYIITRSHDRSRAVKSNGYSLRCFKN